MESVFESTNDELFDALQQTEERLGKFGEHAAAAVPALTKLLGHEHLNVMEAAAEALCQLGPHAAAAVRRCGRGAAAQWYGQPSGGVNDTGSDRQHSAPHTKA